MKGKVSEHFVSRCIKTVKKKLNPLIKSFEWMQCECVTVKSQRSEVPMRGVHRRTGWVSFGGGGGGGLKSLARILPAFLPENGYLKISRGAAPPPPPQPHGPYAYGGVWKKMWWNLKKKKKKKKKKENWTWKWMRIHTREGTPCFLCESWDGTCTGVEQKWRQKNNRKT